MEEEMESCDDDEIDVESERNSPPPHNEQASPAIDDGLTTPERDEIRAAFIKSLEDTDEFREVEKDAAAAKSRGTQENLFTEIHSANLFTVFMPFADLALHATLEFPPDDVQVAAIRRRLPTIHWLKNLNIRENFENFARFYEFRGNPYRMRVLKKLAYNRAVWQPEMEAKLNEIDSSSDEDEPLPHETPRHIRVRRVKRAARAASDENLTPAGRQLPLRPIRLFAEKCEQQRPVKKSRVEFSD
ncbi:hypothetical protein PFISCL1PPCAC_25829 [Pristionchus fissidentatus]|uniref:Uncharacterized protein n=1 Tax=Pristionchus fissidentatus TaxID=1538716 RepID=A0AAV5WTW7_9BILA|nr:hypothetical protein PFISCL1PPCAC_25829 [Pristionchus fissidentatus]